MHRNWKRCPKCHTERSHGHRSAVDADLSRDSQDDEDSDAHISRTTTFTGGLLGLSAAGMAAKKLRRLRSQGERASKLSWYEEGMKKKNGIIDAWAPGEKNETPKLAGILAKLERMQFGGPAALTSSEEGGDQVPWKKACECCARVMFMLPMCASITSDSKA